MPKRQQYKRFAKRLIAAVTRTIVLVILEFAVTVFLGQPNRSEQRHRVSALLLLEKSE